MSRTSFQMLLLLPLLCLLSCKKAQPQVALLQLQSITPASGPRAGGTAVTIKGGGFVIPEIEVLIGGKALVNKRIVDEQTITGTTPPSDRLESVDVVAKRWGEEARLSGGFTYEDIVAPQIVWVYPLPNAQDVHPNQARMRVAFSEPMDPGSININSVYIDGVSGSVTYEEDIASSPPMYIATFTPHHPLAANRVYSAQVTTSVADPAGNHLARTKRWGFRTLDITNDTLFVVPFSASGGSGESSSYKLFCITGQPTPIDLATRGRSARFYLEAGFEMLIGE